MGSEVNNPINENNTTHKTMGEGEISMSTKEWVAQSFSQTLQAKATSTNVPEHHKSTIVRQKYENKVGESSIRCAKSTDKDGNNNITC